MPARAHPAVSSSLMTFKLRVIEQRQVHLVAHRGNVGLVEDQLSGLLPALAQFAANARQRQHIGDGFADGAQDAPVLGRKGLSGILGEVRGRQRYGAYLSGCRPRVESTLHVLVSPLFEAMRSPDLLGQHCCSAVGFPPAGSGEPRPVRRSQRRTAQPRPAFIKQPKGANMSPRLRPDEYFVVTSSRGRPPVWTWEIQSRPKPLGIKLGGADFNSEPGAKLAGENALIEFLVRLGHEEGNVL
jgi:hypothetical protein